MPESIVIIGAGQAGAEWPTAIQIYVSEKGDKFSPVGDLMQMLAGKPPAQGYASFWLAADKLETYGRFVKFACSPKNLGTGDRVFNRAVHAAGDDRAELGADSAGIDVAAVPDQIVPDLGRRLAWDFGAEDRNELVVDVLAERPDRQR